MRLLTIWGGTSKFLPFISQDLLNGVPALLIPHRTFRMMIIDGPKHLTVVVVGVSEIPYNAAY